MKWTIIAATMLGVVFGLVLTAFVIYGIGVWVGKNYAEWKADWTKRKKNWKAAWTTLYKQWKASWKIKRKAAQTAREKKQREKEQEKQHRQEEERRGEAKQQQWQEEQRQQFEQNQKRQAQHDAETNPPPTADCYLLRNGHQDGPFTPSQIKSMWKAGTIPADTRFRYKLLEDWRPVKSFCEKAEVTTQEVTTQTVVGIILLILSVIVTAYFIVYDTSADGHIINLGKQQDQLIGIIIGVAGCIISILMILL